MLSAPTANTFPTPHTSHITRQRNHSATSRLSTWSQIRPFIYKSMLSSNKSNSKWLRNQLSSFEEIIRSEYPKSIVPIIMDDHIRSVLTKHPQSLHKSILKMLFHQIPKLKPATLFFIPSSPKHKPKPHKQKHHKRRHKKSKSNHSHTPNSPTLEPLHSPNIKNNNSDSSIVNSDSSEDRYEHKILEQISKNKPTQNSIQMMKLNQQRTVSSHNYHSSVSDSTHLFSALKQKIHLNLTAEDTDNNIMDKPRNDQLSPSASSRISGFDYNYSDNEQNIDINIITMDDTDEHETNYDNNGYNNEADTGNNAHGSTRERFSVFDALKRKGRGNGDKIVSAMATNTVSDTVTHLANRISDIQNKRLTFDANVSMSGSSPDEIDFVVQEIHEKNDRKRPISSVWYILIYIMNIVHVMVSVWFLINMLMFVFDNMDIIPLFMKVLVYFNVGSFCILELWKVFAAVLFHSCDHNSKGNVESKLHKCNGWRLQFWICLPLVWLVNRSSYNRFLTMNPISIEILFDLWFHYIWMLLLSAMYIAYPFIYKNNQIIYEFQDHLHSTNMYNIISCVLYICTLCSMFIVMKCRSKGTH